MRILLDIIRHTLIATYTTRNRRSIFALLSRRARVWEREWLMAHSRAVLLTGVQGPEQSSRLESHSAHTLKTGAVSALLDQPCSAATATSGRRALCGQADPHAYPHDGVCARTVAMDCLRGVSAWVRGRVPGPRHRQTRRADTLDCLNRASDASKTRSQATGAKSR